MHLWAPPRAWAVLLSAQRIGAELPSACCRTAHKVYRHTLSIIDVLHACQGVEWRLSKCEALMPKGLIPNTNMICEQNNRVKENRSYFAFSCSRYFQLFAQTILFFFQDLTRYTCFYFTLFVWFNLLQYFVRVRVFFFFLWFYGFKDSTSFHDFIRSVSFLF